MIDLHSHILPGIDDGPDNLEGSLAFARAAVASGVSTIAATPHVNSRFQLEADAVAALPGRVAALSSELAHHKIDLQVVKGGEVSFSRLGSLTAEQLAGLCLGEGPCLLVESPYAEAVPMIEEQLFAVRSRGLRPVLAHPERCPAFQEDPHLVATLVEAGTLCLVNAGSLAGSFGRGARRLAISLLRDGLVHAVSSDAHDHADRPPGLLEGLRAAESQLPGLSEQADRLTREAPAAILAGGRLAPPPKLTVRRRRLSDRLRRRG